MVRTKLLALVMVLAFTGAVEAVETTKLSVKDAAGVNDIFTVGDAGSVAIGHKNSIATSRINLYGPLILSSPASYPYGIDIDMNVTGGWAREFGFSYNGMTTGTGKLLAFGARGVDNNLTYGYIGADPNFIAAYDKPFMVFLPDGKIGIGTKTPQQKLEVNGGVRLNYTGTAAKPACDATSRGTLWLNKGTTTDTLEVCLMISSSYLWKQVSLVP